MELSWRAFLLRRRLSPSSRDQHLVAWPVGAGVDEARLLEWELVVPERGQIDDVAGRLRAGGYLVDDAPDGVRTSDPSGTQMHIRTKDSR